jgi:hypothetical protein
MDDNLKSGPPRGQQQPRFAILVLWVLGCALLGMMVGALVGLLLLPRLVGIFVGPDRELRPWDGQDFGGIVGLLVGLYFALRKYVRRF